jgi:hypothetical protein
MLTSLLTYFFLLNDFIFLSIMSQASAIYRSLGGHFLVTMVTAHVEVCVLVSVMDILSYPTKISFKIVILKILISSV